MLLVDQGGMLNVNEKSLQYDTRHIMIPGDQKELSSKAKGCLIDWSCAGEDC